MAATFDRGRAQRRRHAVFPNRIIYAAEISKSPLSQACQRDDGHYLDDHIYFRHGERGYFYPLFRRASGVYFGFLFIRFFVFYPAAAKF